MKIPDNKSLLTAAGNGMLVTALKKAENGDSLILRAVNLGEENLHLRVAAPGELALSSMDETAHGKLTAGANILVRKKKIVTVEISPMPWS